MCRVTNLPVTMQNQLLQAATTGNLAEVKRCIENNVPINQKYEPNGYTALHLSVDGGHRQVVQFLVDSGADISVKDAFGKTALHTAVEKTRVCISFKPKHRLEINNYNRSIVFQFYYKILGSTNYL